MRAANRALIESIQSGLGGNEQQFTSFKYISAWFRNGDIGVRNVNSNLVQYLLQTDIQKRTEKMQWQIQTLHRDFSPGNPNRENQHILY
jgi:hypothetical protein